MSGNDNDGRVVKELVIIRKIIITKFEEFANVPVKRNLNYQAKWKEIFDCVEIAFNIEPPEKHRSVKQLQQIYRDMQKLARKNALEAIENRQVHPVTDLDIRVLRLWNNPLLNLVENKSQENTDSTQRPPSKNIRQHFTRSQLVEITPIPQVPEESSTIESAPDENTAGLSVPQAPAVVVSTEEPKHSSKATVVVPAAADGNAFIRATCDRWKQDIGELERLAKQAAKEVARWPSLAVKVQPLVGAVMTAVRLAPIVARGERDIQAELDQLMDDIRRIM